MHGTSQADWTSPEALDAARRHTAALLAATPSFPDLSKAERDKMAADTVKVLSYMADPDGMLQEIGDTDTTPRPVAATPVQALADDDPVTETKRNLASSPGVIGDEFEAGAVKQGVEQFGELVQKVDFPKFVGGLIKNVFQAIVESSIEQMRAYGELIANVAKTVDQFMADNISEGAGRDYLAEKFPDVMGVSITSGSDAFADGDSAAGSRAVLEARGDDPEARLAQISREMNITPVVVDLTDENSELRLVTAARLEMARSRQQLLSSMVMLGINRIVITDGSIRAKVIFDMRASDQAQRQYTASMHDEESQRSKTSFSAGYGSWYSPVSGGFSTENEQAHVATVASAVDESSESKAEVKSRLSGEVRVNFKSDYLPLDKMATPGMLSTIQGNSTPYNPNDANTDGT